MMLNLTDVLLDGQKIRTEVPIEFDRLDFSFGSFPVTGKTPAAFSIEKDEQEHLVIAGDASIDVEIPCDRCLESVPVRLELRFRETVPAQAQAGSERIQDESGSDEDTEESSFEPGYYLEGYHLDVDKLLFGEALLNWPSRVLCKEDCTGLCPVCGQNLNHGDCGCERKALDPRMAKVLDIFSKFKEV